MRVASISAVVPTYNDAQRLVEALESIAAQTAPPDEVVVCDDCSTDDTEQVVEAFAAAHPGLTVRYVRMSENSGNVLARNEGIRRSSGEWVATLDSDDIWLPAKLERQRRFIEEWDGPELMCVSTYGYNVSADGQTVSKASLGPTSLDESLRRAAKKHLFFLLHSSTLYRRSAFDELGGYTRDYGGADDTEFFSRMSDLGVVIAIPEPLMKYRKRSGSMQTELFRSKQDGRRRLTENRRRERRGLPPLDEAEFEEHAANAPLRRRLRWRRVDIGSRHYRTGSVQLVNGRRLAGAMHLALAAVFEPGRTLTGVRRALRR